MEETKKKKKSKLKIFGIILILIFILCYSGFMFLYTGDIVYSISEDKTYYIATTTTNGPTRQIDKIKVREKHEKLPIKAIDSGAFTKESIVSISLPNTLEAISSNAFTGSAYYKDDASWEITYKEDANGKIEGELYRALYISNYLIEVIFNDEFIGVNGTLPTFTVKDGTLGIAEGAFKTTNQEAEYIAITVKIESDDLSFVGNHANYDFRSHYMSSDRDQQRSSDIFDVKCDNYIILYDGTMSEWLEFDPNKYGGDYTYVVYCQDGTINVID